MPFINGVNKSEQYDGIIIFLTLCKKYNVLWYVFLLMG